MTQVALADAAASRWQAITVSGTCAFSPGTVLATANNLVIGRTYRLSYIFDLTQNSNDGMRVKINQTNTAGTTLHSSDTILTGTANSRSGSILYTAAVTTVVLIGQNNTSGPVGTASSGKFFIEELAHSVTTAFT